MAKIGNQYMINGLVVLQDATTESYAIEISIEINDR